jgi:drug/metabolite transporter (DMT)-like permease
LLTAITGKYFIPIFSKDLMKREGIEELLGITSVIAGAILMGSVAIFIRNINLSPIQTSFFRFFFGFLFLFLFTVITGRRIRIGNKRLLFIMAIINVMLVSSYIASIQLIPAATAALLLYMAPVYVILIAYAMGEKISPKVFLALPLSLVGLFLMLMPEGGLSEGVFFGLIAGFSYAFYFFVMKKLRTEMESIEVTVAYLGLSALILSPSLALPFSDVSIFWLLGLGLVPTAVAFTLFNYGLKYCKISEGPIFALVEPIAAAFFGLIFFAETFTTIQLIGMALVLTGVGIALRKM